VLLSSAPFSYRSDARLFVSQAVSYLFSKLNELMEIAGIPWLRYALLALSELIKSLEC
jgi:hypothetical protein